jgi:hypothetical protein
LARQNVDRSEVNSSSKSARRGEGTRSTKHAVDDAQLAIPTRRKAIVVRYHEQRFLAVAGEI